MTQYIEYLSSVEKAVAARLEEDLKAEDRLIALKKLHTPINTSIKNSSVESEPFPLWALLTIYEKANRECYIDYMKGFKLLLNWLSPIAYPNHIDSEYYAKSNVLGGYEVNELGNILKVPSHILIKCLIERVLPIL